MKTVRYLSILWLWLGSIAWSQQVALESIRSYPFPSQLTAAPQGSRIAWALEEQGKRNVYVAEGPDFRPRRLTNYTQDDGQEITSLSIAANGQWVVFVRGGDHSASWNDEFPVNPTFRAVAPKVKVWSIPFAGGEAKALSDGDMPAISPKSDVVVFLRGNQVWTAPIDGSTEAKNLFATRGSVNSLEWSPDGSQLAFVAARGDHAFVGVFSGAENPIQWIAPSFARDQSPRWSPEGTRLAFIRTPGAGGSPDPILERRYHPWSIWTADVKTARAVQLWKAPETPAGSYPTTHGETNLHWAAGERITFLSYHDGWPHLFSIPSQGGQALLLTPGPFMTEHLQLSADGKWLVCSANAGADKLDIDRRHLVRVPVDRAQVEVLTPGIGLEWTPVVTGDGTTLAFLSATAQRPPVPAVMSFVRPSSLRLIGQEFIPKDYPESRLVAPKQVIFPSPDGLAIHAQLFEPTGGPAKKPAIIYIHGGPPRQMLLGWHYSDYYSNAYASNQYLAGLGFLVLSVNYRLGIGYGFDFHRPPQAGAAGVDIHGVHDWTVERTRSILLPDRFERAPDADQASRIAWESSPIAYVSSWTSPVLIIHGDDDRNVSFSQSADLVNRLEKKGVPLETLVIVDDTHHWMKQSNVVRVYGATADFFLRKLMKK